MLKEDVRKSLGKALTKLNKDIKELNLDKQQTILINKYALHIIDKCFKELNIDVNKELEKYGW